MKCFLKWGLTLPDFELAEERNYHLYKEIYEPLALNRFLVRRLNLCVEELIIILKSLNPN
jgi:hypothetical protein